MSMKQPETPIDPLESIAGRTVLNEVRAILKTPEGRSVVEWATEVMIRLANAEVEKRDLLGALKAMDEMMNDAYETLEMEGCETILLRIQKVTGQARAVIARVEGKTQ